MEQAQTIFKNIEGNQHSIEELTDLVTELESTVLDVQTSHYTEKGLRDIFLSRCAELEHAVQQQLISRLRVAVAKLEDIHRVLKGIQSA